MPSLPAIWCVGGAHVDHIGRAAGPLSATGSTPGAVRGGFGGVALNVAAALAQAGRRVALVGVVGDDEAGRGLRRHLTSMGVEDRLIASPDGTGAYLALEDETGDLSMAVADARALEETPPAAIAEAVSAAPADALMLLDANLTGPQIAAALDVWSGLAAAEAVSTLKAPRLIAILPRLDALFCNLAEARVLAGVDFPDAADAAEALAALGPARIYVTDGPRRAACAVADRVLTATPRRIARGGATGAGDAFVAANLDHLSRGLPPETGLRAGVEAAARILEATP